jgi:hypothetical protein
MPYRTKKIPTAVERARRALIALKRSGVVSKADIDWARKRLRMEKEAARAVERARREFVSKADILRKEREAVRFAVIQRDARRRKRMSQSEWRARLSSPTRFKRFARKELTRGVSAVIGFSGPRGGGRGHGEIQSLRFKKNTFTKAEAKRWAREHGFVTKFE